MEISVFIEKDNKNLVVNVKDSSKIKDLAKKLGIKLNTVIIAQNNNLVTEDAELKNKDRIKIMSVVSGG